MVFCLGGMAWNGNQGCTIYEIGGKLFFFNNWPQVKDDDLIWFDDMLNWTTLEMFKPPIVSFWEGEAVSSKASLGPRLPGKCRILIASTGQVIYSIYIYTCIQLHAYIRTYTASNILSVWNSLPLQLKKKIVLPTSQKRLTTVCLVPYYATSVLQTDQQNKSYSIIWCFQIFGSCTGPRRKGETNNRWPIGRPFPLGSVDLLAALVAIVVDIHFAPTHAVLLKYLYNAGFRMYICILEYLYIYILYYVTDVIIMHKHLYYIIYYDIFFIAKHL